MENEELETEEEILRRLTIVENKVREHDKKFVVLVNELKKRRNVKK